MTALEELGEVIVERIACFDVKRKITEEDQMEER